MVETHEVNSFGVMSSNPLLFHLMLKPDINFYQQLYQQLYRFKYTLFLCILWVFYDGNNNFFISITFSMISFLSKYQSL